MTSTIEVTARIGTPREPIRQEMHQAFDQAMCETDEFRRRYFAGLGLGYAVAFGLVTREALDKARRTPFSVNLHVDFWRPSFFADEDSAWASDQPGRVGKDGKGFSHVEAYEIRAHLIRIFGFARWSADLTDLALVFETENGGKWSVCYRATRPADGVRPGRDGARHLHGGGDG
jgi:hypothetical protein